jgi:hypothetical protein
MVDRDCFKPLGRHTSLLDTGRILGFVCSISFPQTNGNCSSTFSPNCLHQEWRGLKSAPENGLKLLVEAHAKNDQPDIIMLQPLSKEELEDLLVLALMLAYIKNY